MKVPCGGFDLDESVFNVDKNVKQIKLNSPISYDYMPEGYPKKDGWSIEWDGNTDGKTSVVLPNGTLYKISDMVLSYDDLLGATITIMIPGIPEVTSTITSDNVSSSQASDDVIRIELEFKTPGYVTLFLTCVRKDNAYAEGTTFPEKGLYALVEGLGFIIAKENITPMSTDFLPKNLNVVFRGELGHAPTSCNVTYNELRGLVENDIPVLAVLNAGRKVCVLGYIIIGEGYIAFSENSGDSALFKYNSDGTFSGAVPG